MMSKKVISLLVLAVIMAPFVVSAQQQGPPNPNGGPISGGTYTPPSIANNVSDFNTIICKIFAIIFYLLIFLAVVFVLYAAFKYLTSGGDSGKVGEASKILLYAAVAVLVALIAKGIPYIVLSLFGNSNSVTFFSC